MAEIPRELMTEILLYLPVKSLLRFRCASKSLRSLIDCVEFINWHLSTSRESKIIFQDVYYLKFRVCDMNESCSVQQHKQLPHLLNVFGYCNGLLLLHGSSPNSLLWNPSTHQCWTLRWCPPCGRSRRVFGSGLGCDSSTLDYKAVFVLHSKPDLVQVYVYGVGPNTWTRVKHFPFEHELIGSGHGGYTYHHSTGYFADGGLHWLARKNNSQPEILTFDVTKETFALAPLPFCSAPSDKVLTDLHVLDGSLCVSFYGSCMPLQADLYKREKEGGWTQLYCIKKPIISGILRFEKITVLGYSKSRKKILLDFGMEDLVSYDVERTSFGKDETRKSLFWVNPILCVESLGFGGMEQDDLSYVPTVLIRTL